MKFFRFLSSFHKRWSCGLLALLIGLSTFARNHIIIAFDNFVDYENVLGNSGFMQRQINSILKDENGSPLLGDSSYVSIVTFGLGRDNPDFSEFAKVSSANGQPLLWREYTGWKDIFPSGTAQVLDKSPSRFRGPGFSLLSGAKPFIISAAKSPGADKVAERTFILMVTDDHYNGNDNYRKEFQTYQEVGGKASEKEFTRQVTQYHTLFKDVEKDRKMIGSGHASPYYLILLEVVPTNIPSINGVLDIPANLNIHREPRVYRIDFDSRSVDDLYELRGLDVKVIGKDGKIYRGNADTDGHLDMSIPTGAVDPKDINVKLSGVVLQKDGLYDGLLASPENPNTPRMQASRSLSVAGGGRIFGMTMPDALWWWYPSDADKAAFLWEIILILALLALSGYAIKRYNKRTTLYNLKNHEISIRAVGSVKTRAVPDSSEKSRSAKKNKKVK